MKPHRLAILVCAGILLGSLLYFFGGSTAPAGQPALVRLNAENLPELQKQFNAAQDRVRLIAMLSPT